MAEEKKAGYDSLLVEGRKFYPSKEFVEHALIKSMDEYKKMYDESIKNPDAFWGKQAENLEWFKKWDKVSYWDPEKVEIKWFEGGKLNVSVNCLDRHVKAGKKDRVGLIWEGEPEGDAKKFTYGELLTLVCKAANALKSLGVKKGDRVCIYLPMIPELAIAMLACTRIGAIHSIVFGGFSAEALRDRIQDSACKILITSDGSFRSGKNIPLKKNADAALKECPSIEKSIIVKRTGGEVTMQDGRDIWWNDIMAKQADTCDPEPMDAEDPLFILYTSGSTGKPKGVLHTTAGYLLYTSLSHKYIFDYHEDDVYWCTADIGWVTGHSYIVYGPLCNCAQTLMFEGVPNFPKPDRFWAVVEKYKVNIFYTAPTALRAMMRDGDDWPKGRDLSSLRLLGSVGEPINPEAWIWYYTVIGKEKCPIVDTWWQTETGGILITPLAGAMFLKPGSATLPFFGVEPAVVGDDGKPVDSGKLIIKKPWPGIMRTVYGDHQRFKETYWTMYPGLYFTGDGCRKDEDGYYWLLGRVDDVINVSGHRLGTMEVESALVSHEKVAEAAVVGMPHDIKGQGIYAYVTPIAGIAADDALKKELVAHVRKEIGPIATPDIIHFADALPKTRSGKIMRRILRKIAENDFSNLGDTSTLADPTVVTRLIEERPKK